MKIIIALSLIITSLLSAQIKVPDDYKKIPDILDTTEYLYPFVIPNKEYEYWRVLTNDNDPDKAIIYESQAPLFMTINEPAPEKGFFQKCIEIAVLPIFLPAKKKDLFIFPMNSN
ncbi:hypothetical protein [Chryseobacterium capnotolerans]|uniref:hypothetical protein n=1 Tax=Chryseobacterium capnotolerans TaxID=2759528 RepID=UPI001E5B9C07|nr:hypothetical protein [Chryseobacterium capnotolerans]